MWKKNKDLHYEWNGIYQYYKKEGGDINILESPKKL